MMVFSTPPYLLQERSSVRRVMLQVLLALLPGIAAYVWLIGPGIVVQLVIATLTALAGEAFMLALRRKRLALFLSDGSAIVTAWLIALSFPPLAPWWLIVVGTLLAIVVAKHLYGGLGQNPFNPAMVAFAACIVSFPALMSQWPALGLKLDFLEQLQIIAGLRKIITWQAPVAFIGGLTLLAGILWAWNPQQFANPVFHLFSGGALLGAFFIVTDPVSGCTTPRGKLIFGLLAGLLAYIIRVFGGFPDGVAFAVLLMNLCVPLIDMYSQPPIFGLKNEP